MPELKAHLLCNGSKTILQRRSVVAEMLTWHNLLDCHWMRLTDWSVSSQTAHLDAREERPKKSLDTVISAHPLSILSAVGIGQHGERHSQYLAPTVSTS